MAIWYFDPDGGNQSNDGKSFANRKKYVEYANRAQFSGGDEIRFMKSPDPTSLGNALWTCDSSKYGSFDWWRNNPAMNGRTASGVFSHSGTNPISCVDTAHGLDTGDTIGLRETQHVIGSFEITKVDDDNFTLDGTENFADFTDETKTYNRISPFRVLLANPCTENIICYQSKQTGDLDWTATLGSTQKETGTSVGYQTARSFKPGNSGTGKAAYVELDSALDLSGYQQISLMVYWDYLVSSQEDDDSILSLRLCTDTTGDTSVHTIPITHGFDNSDDWYAVVCDLGTNLNASIQSVAIYVDTQMAHANNEVIIDNVIACKAKSSADSLTHASLISKGNTHQDVFYPLSLIDGRRLIIKSWGQSISHNIWYNVAGHPYPGTTETVTTYKRECFRRPTFRSTTERKHSPFFNIDEGVTIGQSATQYTVSGGWNTTDMSSQDTNSGTWLDCIHEEHYNGMYIYLTNQVQVSQFGLVRGRAAILNYHQDRFDGRNSTFTNINSVNHMNGLTEGPGYTFNNCVFTTDKFEMDDEGANYNGQVIFKDCTFWNSSWDYDSQSRYQHVVLLNPTIRGTCSGWGTNGRYFNYAFRNMKVLGGSINNVGTLFTNQTYHVKGGRFRMANTLINNDSAAPIEQVLDRDTDTSFNQYGENHDHDPVILVNYNNVATDHRIYFYGAEVLSETSVRNTASGIAWKLRPWHDSTYSGRRGFNYVKWRIAETAVNASAQVTLTAYVRRSHTGINVKLAALAEDNYHVGITSDANSSAASASVDTWEQLTLNVTPTAAGTIQFTCLFSNDSGSPDEVGYIDDIAITQA